MRVSVLMIIVFAFASTAFGQAESLNRRIQEQLNQPIRHTTNFEIKPVRVLSEEAERRYQDAIETQHPEALRQATIVLKENASKKRAPGESDRNVYKQCLDRLKYVQSTDFKPRLSAIQEGAIGHPVSLKILEALPDGLVRAEVGFGFGVDKSEVFVMGFHTTSNNDGAWAKFEDEIVLEVHGTRSYSTVLGNDRSLPLLDIIDVATFHERLSGTKERTVRETKSTTPKVYSLREWTDASGKHKTKATFAGLGSGGVSLRKEDGSVIKLPVDKLSADDRKYIESLRD